MLDYQTVRVRTLLYLLLGILVIGSLAYVASGDYFLGNPSRLSLGVVDVPPNFPGDAPSPSTGDRTEVQSGFQYLVSFGESGFQPAQVSIVKGERVRFTNNSLVPLQVVIGDKNSPMLQPRNYWEHKFLNSGSITVE